MRSSPLLLALLLLALPRAARADERILHFLSAVDIARDGSLDVTETITVRAEGVQIRRGIYRDFPTRYSPALFTRRVQIPFTVVDVHRDETPEPWVQESLTNGVRVRIGDPTRMLVPGVHVYRIRYRTDRQLGHFDGYDELYWNATGNDWAFPIDVAVARIRLPEPVRFGQRHAYTGPQGSKAQDAVVAAEGAGEITFQTTSVLGEREGLTIAASFPKGVVRPPDQARGARGPRDAAPIVFGIAGLVGVLAFYFRAWQRAGRNPRPGTIVPLFSPADELSPAGMRYVREMGADSRAFAAALISLAVKGKLRLVEGEKRFFGRAATTLVRTGEPTGLPPEEAEMMRRLFSGGDSLLIDDANHSRFSAAQKALRTELKHRFDGQLFVINRTWSFFGLMALAVALGVAGAGSLLTAPDDARPAGALPAALVSLGAVVVAGFLMKPKPRAGATGLKQKILAAAVVGLAGIPATVMVQALALATGPLLPPLFPLLALPVVVSAFWWMPAPTQAGRQVLDRIAGFEQYLSIAEEDRLERMHPPAKTPELFERYLPYAIALRVENRWADKFAGLLAAAGTQPVGWYAGHSDLWSRPNEFVRTVGSSLSQSVASASSPPGSSSGSSGGGSSGGGGGGGGGGGW